MLDIILDFSETAWLTLKRFLRGNTIIVTPGEEYRRLLICQDCIYLRGDSEKNFRCSLCKCFLRFKLRTAASDCPVGKWPRIDP